MFIKFKPTNRGKELTGKWLKEVFVMEKRKEFEEWLEVQIAKERIVEWDGKFYLPETNKEYDRV